LGGADIVHGHRITLAAALALLTVSPTAAAHADIDCEGSLLQDRGDDQLGAPALSNADLRRVRLQSFANGRQSFAIDLASLHIDPVSSGIGVDYLLLYRVRSSPALQFVRAQTATASPRFTYGSATAMAGVVTLSAAGTTQGTYQPQGFFDPPWRAVVWVVLPAALPVGDRPIESIQAVSLVADEDTNRVRVITPATRLDEAGATAPGVSCRPPRSRATRRRLRVSVRAIARRSRGVAFVVTTSAPLTEARLTIRRSDLRAPSRSRRFARIPAGSHTLMTDRSGTPGTRYRVSITGTDPAGRAFARTMRARAARDRGPAHAATAGGPHR
jgi:hypothetical protein